MDVNQKRILDSGQLFHVISEREAIISTYKTTGYLDRDHAIEKIKELRITDNEVAAITTAKLAVSSIPFSRATNESIVSELQMQVDILKAKILKTQ